MPRRSACDWPQSRTRGGDELLSAMAASRFAYSEDDLTPAGYYVIAQNRQ